MKKRRQWIRKKPQIKREPSKEKDKKHPLICYECKISNHFRSDCPQLKEAPKKFKKKVMVAIWSDSDNSNSDKDTYEEANFCLMAHENEGISESSSEFTFDKLQEIFYDLLDDLKKLGLKNK